MSAVDELLKHLSQIEEIVDFLASPPNATPQSALDGLARAVSLQGLLCFEEFLRARSTEWVSLLSAARVSPTVLPGGSKRFEDRILQTLPRTLQAADVATRAQLIDDVGKALSSLSTANLVAHRLAFAWPGSNVQSSDIEVVLGMMGVEGDRQWSEMTSLWRIVDQRFPGNTSAKSLFESFSRLRHDAAHALGANLPLANLSSVTRSVRLIAMCTDVLVSDGLRQIRLGASPVVVRGSQIPVRKIVRDGKKWPEFAPGHARAVKRHDTLPAALIAASGRAMSKSELVLALDGSEVVDWRYPAL